MQYNYTMNTLPLIGSPLTITCVEKLNEGLRVSAREGTPAFAVKEHRTYDFSHMSADDWEWITGIYEGEGTVCYIEKGQHLNCRIKMTGRDVVQRVGALWQRAIIENKPEKEHHKASYSVSLKGAHAVVFLSVIHNGLSKRRQEQATLKCQLWWQSTYEAKGLISATKMRQQYQEQKRTFKEWAAYYSKPETTIRNILRGNKLPPWCAVMKPYGMPTLQQLAAESNAWLAGYIEGEGSFTSHGISQLMIVSAVSTDRDVIEALEKSWNGSAVETRDDHPGWKPQHRIRLYDEDGITTAVKNIHPYLGIRRKERSTEMLCLRVEWLKTSITKRQNAKLTEKQVMEVKRLRAETNMTLKEIGIRFGVGLTLIENITSGHSYSVDRSDIQMKIQKIEEVLEQIRNGMIK